jgi:hypothetical protein
MNYFREMHKIRLFVDHLSDWHGENTFNPWGDFDPDYDVAYARSIRRQQLEQYLVRRMESARILLIAEACGYQGGRFTGIAMTCERMLLNLHPVVNSQMVIGSEGRRTSRDDSPFIPRETQRTKGFNEPTDTIVWKAALDAGLKPEDFILWNIFPFHPHKPNQMMTNRTPTPKELKEGLHFTRELLDLTGPLPIYAIGRKSENTLTEAGYEVTGLRHPANGGATMFRTGLSDSLQQRGLYD